MPNTRKQSLHQLKIVLSFMLTAGVLIIAFQQCAPPSGLTDENSTAPSRTTRATSVSPVTPFSPATSITYLQNQQSSRVQLPASGSTTVLHQWESTGAHSVEISYRLASGSCSGHDKDDSAWHKLEGVTTSNGMKQAVVDASIFDGCSFEFVASAQGSNSTASASLLQCWGRACISTPEPQISYTQNGRSSRISFPGQEPITVIHEWNVAHATSFRVLYRLYSGNCPHSPGNSEPVVVGSISGMSGRFEALNNAADWNGCTFEFTAEASGPGGTVSRRFYQCWGSACPND